MRKSIAQQSQTKRKKKGKFLRAFLFFLFLVILMVSVGLAVFILTSEKDKLKMPVLDDESDAMKPVNILFLGVDAGDGDTRTDTIILTNIDAENKRINMISVPRDTRIEDFRGNTIKINAANAIGGPERAVSEVENLLGVSIPYYMKIDFEGFKNVIDILGGVKVNVEKGLHYTDRAGNTYINIEPGYQRLDGQQALDYVRFRHDPLGDLGRITRQQNFLQALSTEMLKTENILKWPAILKQALQHIQTNISSNEISDFLRAAKKMSGAQVEMSTLPGEGKYIGNISYFIIDPVATSQLINEKINGIGTSNIGGDAALPPLSSCRLEVLNGTGIGGIGKYYADLLRNEGFQVVRVDNAADFNYKQNEIIRHNANLHTGLLQKVLSIVGNGRVTEDSASSAVDLTIIIGQSSL